jgi:hypothetical protein
MEERYKKHELISDALRTSANEMIRHGLDLDETGHHYVWWYGVGTKWKEAGEALLEVARSCEEVEEPEDSHYFRQVFENFLDAYDRAMKAEFRARMDTGLADRWWPKGGKV